MLCPNRRRAHGLPEPADGTRRGAAPSSHPTPRPPPTQRPAASAGRRRLRSWPYAPCRSQPLHGLASPAAPPPASPPSEAPWARPTTPATIQAQGAGNYPRQDAALGAGRGNGSRHGASGAWRCVARRPWRERRTGSPLPPTSCSRPRRCGAQGRARHRWQMRCRLPRSRVG